MAIDEAIFRQFQRSAGMPTLRFYGWSNPSVSLGYFQRVENEIDLAVCRKEGIDIVFRPTGGKAVFHDDDFTYALIAGEKDAVFTPDIQGTYRVISRCLVTALCRMGIAAELAGRTDEDDPNRLQSACFSAPSPFELLVGHKKICGSAQVRSRGVFLQHGSLLTTFDPVKTYEVLLPHREPKDDQIKRLRASVTSVSDHLTIGREDLHRYLGSELAQAFTGHFNVILREGTLTGEEEDMKRWLLQTKYRQEQPKREGRPEAE